MSFIEGLFADPKLLVGPVGFVQMIVLLVFYGYVLAVSAAMISRGSELLLLVPSMTGIVGSLVLPILGAVPDGALILFSGLGPDAQNQLNVGVGALAGSTILLLTVPWVLGIIYGRVDIDKDGNGSYTARPKMDPAHRWRLSSTGVNVHTTVKLTGRVMMLTSLSYIIIQGPAFAEDCSRHTECHRRGKQHTWALVGIFLSIIGFFGYLWFQVRTQNSQDRMAAYTETLNRAIRNGNLTLVGAFADMVAPRTSGSSHTLAIRLLKSETLRRELRATLRFFFNKYDPDRTDCVDERVLGSLLRDLGERLPPEDIQQHFLAMDTNHDGVVDFDEFCHGVERYIQNRAINPGSIPRFTSVYAGSSTHMTDHGVLGVHTSDAMYIVPEEYNGSSPLLGAVAKRAARRRAPAAGRAPMLGETHVGRFKARQLQGAGASGHTSRDGSPGRVRNSPASAGPGLDHSHSHDHSHDHDHDHDLVTGGIGVTIATSGSGRPVGSAASSVQEPTGKGSAHVVGASGAPNPALRSAIQVAVEGGGASASGYPGGRGQEGVSRPGDTPADHSINGMPEGQGGDVESGGLHAPLLKDSVAAHDDDDEEAEEEMPTDLQALAPEEQQRRIKWRAVGLMCTGMIVVLIFSDPMVNLLSEMANRVSIPPFYVAFVVAPVASNALEMVASIRLAMKKTPKSSTAAMATLEGAACMNNTFCLTVFLVLVYARGLAWEFAAETISIIVIQILAGAIAQKTTHTVLDGLMTLSLYPFALILVVALKSAGLN